MKLLDNIKIALASILLLLSCKGEDRTHEYLALTQHNNWVYEVMTENYLWADTLQMPDERKFFGDPSTFLKNLTSKVKEDKWSYLTVDTIVSDPFERGNFNHNESYGMDFMLVTDPTGQTTKQYARVVSVFIGSAAKTAGLKRGDYIVSFNGYKLSSSNVTKLKKGGELQLKVCHLAEDVENNTFYWSDTVDHVLPASVKKVYDMVPNNISYVKMDDTVVGYYCITNMSGDGVSSFSDICPISQYARQMKNAGAKELVLDLRLCNQGDMETAQWIASTIVKPELRNGIFAKTIRNKAKSSLNADYSFLTDVESLGLDRVFILTSGYTQGAAEWLIHSLQAVMGTDNVITIGTKTAGQNVMTDTFRQDNYFITFHPIVAYVADANGDYDYASGIEPTYAINEFEYLYLGEYGEPSEILFHTALGVMQAQ